MDESVGPDRQLGCTDGARLLSTREAATEIGCSVRHARRLAAGGHGFRLVDQNWVFREGDVRALKQDFEERNEMEYQPTEYPAEWGYAAPHDPVGLAIDSFVASLTAAEFNELVARTRGGAR
jgi:hypothetical protein